MPRPSSFDQSLFEGLQSLSESSFPKFCRSCGRRFDTAQQFLSETDKLPKGSGLKASWDDDDQSIVELYRNCVCGSTLMDFFSDRREIRERGLKRREKFAKLIILLEKRGMNVDKARNELKNLLRGQGSTALEAMGLTFRI
jgi:hypothetical protein